MATPARPIPTYGLYGDEAPPDLDEFFHCETIAVRSQRYDWEISPHVHPALSQMLFVSAGTVELRLGLTERRLHGPVLVCAPRDIVHGFRFSADVVGYVVTVAQDFLDSLSRQDALRIQLGRAGIHPLSAAQSGRLTALGTQLVEAEQGRFDPNMHRLHRALAEAWLRTAIRPGIAAPDRLDTLAQRFQSLVERRYREHRPLSFYAEHLNCTVRTLTRQTEDAFGMTPLQIVNRRLLFEARRLLRFTNANCSEVAAELGFEDPSYFSRFYRRMTGHSPSAEKQRTDR
ncbi:MAG: helix-turn-helix domain-containing protein [Sphingomonas sp.]|nr:helix-turn-helix domain-containing protein [Sphingomonas sp.]